MFLDLHNGVYLVGLGATLAGLGSFLSGWAAYRAYKKRKNGNGTPTQKD